MPKPFGLLAFLLLGTSCGDAGTSASEPVVAAGVTTRAAPATPARATASSPAPVAPVAAERAMVAWLQANAQDPSVPSLYEGAIENDVERAGLCKTAACRAAVTRDRIARADFVAGRPTRLPGLPWPHGRFEPSGGGLSGSFRIFPLSYDAVMVVAQLVGTEGQTCSIEGSMTRQPDGTFRLTSYRDAPELTLTPNGTAGFTLAYTDLAAAGDGPGYCGQGTVVVGSYRLAGTRATVR